MRALILVFILLLSSQAKSQINCSVMRQSSCGHPNGIISAIASFGTPPYQYSIDAGLTYQMSGYFARLGAGTYIITAKDNLGSTRTATITITNQSLPPEIGVTSTDITSCSMNDGTILATAWSGSPPYQFSLDGANWQNNGTFSNLFGGFYTVIVKDANGCTMPKGMVPVGGVICPAIDAIIYGSSVGCTTKGTINYKIDPSDTHTYTFSIDGINFQNNGLFSNLDAGVYPLHVKDDSRNIHNVQGVTVGPSCEFHVIATPSHIPCAASFGSISAMAAAGRAPYRYSLDGINFQNNNNFSNLVAGTYTVIVADADGFVTSELVTIDNACLTINLTTTGTTCGYNNGKIIVNASGGAPPYYYSIDGINFQSGNIFSSLEPKNYVVTVSDRNGTKETTSASVPGSIYDLGVSATVQPSVCISDKGSITLTGFGGIAPYEYSLNGFDYQSSQTFNDVFYGPHKVFVKDVTGCLMEMYPVYVPYVCYRVTATAVTATCNNNNGSITAEAFDGVAPVSYSINGIQYQSGTVFNNLSDGTYTVTAKDATNALTTTQVVVGNNCLTINAMVIKSTCENANGIITITAENGSVPYTYSMDGINYQADADFAGVAAGNYTVFAKDNTGAIGNTSVVMTDDPNYLTLSASSPNPICEGSSLRLNLQSNADEYSWLPAFGLSNTSIKNPVASPTLTTKYTVTARKGACSKTETIDVIVNPAPIAQAGVGNTICFGANSQLQASGGIRFSWSPSDYLSDPDIADPMVIKPQESITYYLTITDNNNCLSLQKPRVTITVTPPAKIFAGNDTVIAKNQLLKLFAADVNNSGFIEYNWSPAYGLSNRYISSPIATIDKNITYRVTAKTAAGCESTDELSIKVYNKIDIYVANAFTPNGDGKNDFLIPLPVGIKTLIHFSVFNRWGQPVFKTASFGIGWDGKIKGMLQDNSTYVWSAEGIDYNGNIIKRKGSVVLVR